jgi:DNA mismatch endonuclease (patch repair protein)
MSAQRTRDTAPERLLRQDLFSRGLRYRVNFPVPGKRRRTIDIAFTKAKLAVFVDGCFWHGCAEHKSAPKANGDWWARKIETNRHRDAETRSHLESMGWCVVRVWEHEDVHQVASVVERTLAGRSGRSSADPVGLHG